MILLNKNYINVDGFDFNTLAEVIDHTNSKSVISSNYLNEQILESCFQLKGSQTHSFFKNIWTTLEKQYNPTGSKDSSIDIFLVSALGVEVLPMLILKMCVYLACMERRFI